MRFEDLRHLRDRQPLGKRDRDEVHLAPRDLVDDGDGRHRLIEPVLARFQPPRVPAEPKRRPICRLVANHAGGHEVLADRFRAGARWNVNELFGLGVAAIRVAHALVHERRRATGDADQEEEDEREFFHCRSR